MRKIPTPTLPGDDWVSVRTLLGGICGSDTAMAMQKQPPDSLLQAYTSQPMLMGHENVSVVEKVGDAVDKSWIGKRVVVEPTLGCQARGTDPMCPRCQAGEFGACENFSGDLGGKYNLPPGSSIGYNSATGGSWGEYFVAHKSQLIELDDSLADENALMVDPFACSLHAILMAEMSDVKNVLIYGCGSLGLGAIAALRATGFTGKIEALGGRSSHMIEAADKMGADEVFTLPRDKRQRFEAMASRTGATLQRARFNNYMLSGGYDLVIDCVGSAQSVMECLKFTRARGQMIMLGTLQGEVKDLSPLWFRELKIRGSWGRAYENYNGQKISTYQLVLDMMREGKIDTTGLVTHLLPVEDYREALAISMNKSQHKAIKIAFDFRK